MSILTRMGLASKAGAPTDTLSQVELRKMELARAMAVRPKLLISDEAMAGLSHSEVDEVLDLLISLGEEDITIIMIEHIMQAVMRFSERMMCLDAGKIIAHRRAGRSDGEQAGAGGLSWHLALPSRASMPATAPSRRCAASRSHVESGETVALLGTNGNGKSTLMKCIMGLVRPDRGRISLTIDGAAHDLTKLSAEAIVDLGVALVPEGRRLFPKLTVMENLMLGAFRQGRPQRHRSQSRARLRDLSGAEGARATSSPAPCPADNSRCSRSRAR